MIPYKTILYIKWSDSTSDDDWIEKSKSKYDVVDEKFEDTETIGWYVGESKTGIMVAGSQNKDCYAMTMFIPKVCILKIKKVV